MVLIDQIIRNPSFNWDFVFQNVPTEKPIGQIVFLTQQELHQEIASRVCIVKTKSDYHIITHLLLTEYNNKKLVDYEALIEYQKSKNADERMYDLDNPCYNIELHFPISKEFYFGFLTQMKDIQVSLTSSGFLYHKGGFRNIMVRRDHYKLELQWGNLDPRYDEVASLMDHILNHSLQHISTAYWTGI